MFNLHQYESMIPIFLYRKEQILKDMQMQDFEINVNEVGGRGLAQKSTNMMSSSDNKGKDKNDDKKIMDRLMSSFVGSLRVPCYDKVKYYYYYDVIEALSRHLF